MNLYSTSVFIHVLTAILGVGPLAALAVMSTGSPPPNSVAWFPRILRLVGWSLAGMLVTGILIVAQTHGALGKTGWVRVSLGLSLVIGALLGTVRRRFKQNAAAIESGALPQGVGALLWTMCGLIAAITYLMETKPW